MGIVLTRARERKAGWLLPSTDWDPPVLAQGEAGGFGVIFKMKKAFKEPCKHFAEWVSVDVICITSI